jgi:acetyltransferase-like isoleucine patch superfamily enzyme
VSALQPNERLDSLWTLCAGRLRARVLAARGARVGAKTAMGPRCIVIRPRCLELGDRVSLEADVYLKMVADSAALALGDSVFIGRGAQFDVAGRVAVGAHTVIAPRCFVTDHQHGTQPGLRIDQQPCAVAPVTIGADVWLGTGVVVLPGVHIGDGAVVGANSVVTKDVAPMSVVAGAPARFLRMRAAGNRDGQ